MMVAYKTKGCESAKDLHMGTLLAWNNHRVFTKGRQMCVGGIVRGEGMAEAEARCAERET